MDSTDGIFCNGRSECGDGSDEALQVCFEKRMKSNSYYYTIYQSLIIAITDHMKFSSSYRIGSRKGNKPTRYVIVPMRNISLYSTSFIMPAIYKIIGLDKLAMLA